MEKYLKKVQLRIIKVRCSFLAAEQGHSLEFPVLWGLHLMRVLNRAGCAISLEPGSENQVPIVTLGIFVDRAEVVGVFSVFGVVLFGARHLICHHCSRLS
jgi:urease beta subunit